MRSHRRGDPAFTFDKTSSRERTQWPQCGHHGTLSLRKLDDGQNDDMATLRKRRAEEDAEASARTGRPPWNFTTSLRSGWTISDSLQTSPNMGDNRPGGG